MKSSGFSLVENAIALAIFAFCLFALLGLFSVGLKTQRDSQDDESAAAVLSDLSLAVENSSRSTNGTMTCGAPLQGWTWNITGVSVTNGKLGEYAFWLSVQPAATNGGSLLASTRVEVAWPADTVTWDANGRATNVRGFASSTAFFFVK